MMGETERLEEIGLDLLEWEQFTGGSEAPVWAALRAVITRSLAMPPPFSQLIALIAAEHSDAYHELFGESPASASHSELLKVYELLHAAMLVVADVDWELIASEPDAAPGVRLAHLEQLRDAVRSALGRVSLRTGIPLVFVTERQGQ